MDREVQSDPLTKRATWHKEEDAKGIECRRGWLGSKRHSASIVGIPCGDPTLFKRLLVEIVPKRIVEMKRIAKRQNFSLREAWSQENSNGY